MILGRRENAGHDNGTISFFVLLFSSFFFVAGSFSDTLDESFHHALHVSAALLGPNQLNYINCCSPNFFHSSFHSLHFDSSFFPLKGFRLFNWIGLVDEKEEKTFNNLCSAQASLLFRIPASNIYAFCISMFFLFFCWDSNCVLNSLCTFERFINQVLTKK